MYRTALLCLAISIALTPAAHHSRGRIGGQAATPHPRGHHTVFYDEARQRVMVAGGTWNDSRRNYELLNDLWAFDGTSWTELPSSGAKMSGHRIALDAQQHVFSFGGFLGEDNTIGDLRLLEG